MPFLFIKLAIIGKSSSNLLFLKMNKTQFSSRIKTNNQMAKHLQTGKQGEERAVSFLQKKGYEILETNWRFRRAEIDIIAKKQKVLIFVEVKTRSYDFFGKPESFVNERKKALITDAAMAYMRAIGHTWEIRFDIIGILLERPEVVEIKHFEDAFFPGMSP